ncbi:MAG: lipopolysaccharide biosynthesis protein [Candidatus Omnitrophica bacterium]|nr:lipopolysaccharide biosynthesis protein [Candidatus Omnitrophota bacterium]
MDNNQTQETSLRDYVRVLFRHKSVIITTMITVCATVFIGLILKTPVYESSVKMLITAEKQVEATYYKEMYGARDVQQTLTQSEIVKSEPVLGRVVRSLNLHKRTLADEKKFSSFLKGKLLDYQTRIQDEKLKNLTAGQKEAILFRQAMLALKENIRVEPIRDTNMFTISIRDYNPIGAAVIANVVSRSYVMFDLEQQLAELKLKYGKKHPTVNLLDASITKLRETLSGNPMDDVEAIGPASVKIMEQASVALEPTGTSKVLTLIVAFIMSIFLGVMLAFVFEYSDQTLRSPGDIEKNLGFSVIGSIAKKSLFDKTLIEFDKNLTGYGKSYQIVSDQLYMLIKNKGLKSLLIASTLKEENNAVVIANLGSYMAKMLKCKLLIIDANLKSPSINRLFNLAAEPGLTGFLDGIVSLPEITNKIAENLSVITSGKTANNSMIMMESPRMKQILEEARKQYDIILVNAAHMNGQKDTAILSALVDGIVLVVDEGKARHQVVKNAAMNMNGKLENTIGVILNERKLPIPRFVYDNV